MFRRRSCLGLVAVAATLGLFDDAAAIVLVEPCNARHDRIRSTTGLINPGFLFYDYDVSGIAINQDTLQDAGRAIMITPQHFATTSHTAGTHPNTLDFLTQDGAVRTYDVDHYDRIGTTDLTIGTLARPIAGADGIASYAIPRFDEASFEGAMLGLFAQRQLAGINRYVEGFEGLRHDFDFDQTRPWGRGGDEAALIVGDSGHPMVAAYTGELFALGVHTGSNLSTSLVAQIDEIAAVVDDEGQSLRVVDRLPRHIASFLPDTTTVPLGESVEELTRVVSHHPLTAPNASARPTLVAPPDADVFTVPSRPVLRFAGDDRLVAGDTDTPDAQAFMFELNSEYTRIGMVARLDDRPAGTSTLLHVSYNDGTETIRLSFDHATQQMTLAAFGSSITAAASVDVWQRLDLAWQERQLKLTIDGTEELSILLDQAFAQSISPDFDALAIGSTFDGSSGLVGHMSDVHFSDTGLRNTPNVEALLNSRYVPIPESSAVAAGVLASVPLLGRRQVGSIPVSRHRLDAGLAGLRCLDCRYHTLHDAL